MSLIVEFLGSMTKCLNSKKMLRSNCISSNSDDNNTNSASKVAIRNRLKMEKKLERLSNLTKKLLDDLEEQEDINNNNSIGESGELYEYNFITSHQQDTDIEENETTGIHNNGKLATQRDFPIINSDSVCLKECVVCLACPARIETMPCRHTVLCKRCFLRTIQTVIAQGTATLKCVLCRTKIVAINELEPIARRSGVYNGEKHPTRSTDPIKPKFSKLQNQPVPCKSAVSLFRRSGRVQDSNGTSSPTHTYHLDPNCQHPTQVRRKQDRIYHLLPSDCNNTFDDRT